MDLSARRPGPDVVRALAMLGVVVMNYHGYLILRGGDRGSGMLADLFDPWAGPLATRFAATFVLTAGVGVTLMTRSSIGDADRTRMMRWRLVRRGLLLYGIGLLFDTIWRGTILPFYGAMFVLAALLFTLRSRWVVTTGVAAALAAAAIRWWRYEATLDGHDTTWLTDPGPRSPRGLLFDLFVNGTHPLLPWLAFLCAGIVLGRFIGTTWWRPAASAAGFVLYAGSTIASSAATSDRALVLLSTDPFERGLVYTANALGTSLLAFAAISWVADRFADSAGITALQQAGQMSLSIYLAHALVFNLAVGQLGVVEPAGLGTALAFALGFWLVATTGAIAYERRYGRGPAERLYRLLSD
jgi:uncharacterized membrane protein YeiB